MAQFHTIFYCLVVYATIGFDATLADPNDTACFFDWHCVWTRAIPYEPTEGHCVFHTIAIFNWTKTPAPPGPANLLVTCDSDQEAPDSLFACMASRSGEAKIESMKLYTCNAINFTNGSLDSFIYLEKLSLQYGSIARMDDDVFYSSSHLQAIEFVQYYTSNSLRSYPRALIGQMNETDGFLPSLRILHLENFGLGSSVPVDAFSNLKHLRNLSLINIQLDNGGFEAMTSLTALQYLEVRKNWQIDDIPTYVFRAMPSLDHLALAGTIIKLIGEHELSSLEGLISLDLSSNSIRYIHPAAFSDLTELRSLDLHGNSLLGLNGYSPSFYGMPRLARLYMDDCTLTNLSNFHFRNVTTLEELVLRNNRLTEVPNIFANFEVQPVKLPELKLVDLSENSITDIGSYTFSNLHMLKRINLAINDLQYVGQNVFFNLGSIERIDLQGNRIQNIDMMAFHYIDTLQILDLRLNELWYFPFLPYYVNSDLGLDGLPENPFQTFLEGNPFRCDCVMFGDLFEQDPQTGEWTLPYYSAYIWPGTWYLSNQRFADRERLICYSPVGWQYLSVRIISGTLDFYSELTSESDCQSPCSCVFQCVTDHVFVLCENASLAEVPVNLTSVVTVISLKHNSITNLTRDSFLHIPNLQFLYLGYNMISYIEDGSFLPLRTLFDIQLNDNDISEVNSAILNTSSPRIASIDLSTNRISSIPNDTFNEMTSVQWISLHSNQLSIIPDGVFDDLHNLSGLFVIDNPLTCSCDILYLINWYRDIVFTEGISLTTDIPQLPCNDTGFSNETELDQWIRDEERACSPQPTVPVVTVEVTQIVTVSTQKWYLSAGSAAFAFVFTAVLCWLIYYYRLEILVFIYIKTGLKPFSSRSPDDDNKEYDAFISFSSLDRDFVLEELLPRLESQESRRRLCIHHRDFIVGECIATNIINAIEKKQEDPDPLLEELPRE